jgi:tRNA nucleotidyltransferase (CCA-adding enzyme)
VAGSRRFTENPSPSLFFEPKVKPLTKLEFQRQLGRRGSDILCVAMGRCEEVVDILWSQLFRTQRALVNLLEGNDFEVVKSAAWSDEKTLSVLLFELGSSMIPHSRKHYGPPISRVSESSSFLAKHAKSGSTIAGPWIENDRWAVLKRRPYTSARALLASTLRSGGKSAGVASLMVRAFKKDAKLYEGLELTKLLSVNAEFGKFMRSYLTGRPVWLA